LNKLATVDTTHFGIVSVVARRCPLCNRDNDATPPSRFSHAPWTIRDCPDCGFVYIDRAPHYDVQFETMAWSRTTLVEEGRRAELRPISYRVSKSTRFRMAILHRRTMLDFITKRLSGGNLLDLGCGDGHILLSFPASFTPFGIDISVNEAADQDFRSRGGYAVTASCVEGLRGFSDGFFAAASLRSYLEHESQPLRVLQNLWRALAPGGIAVVKVPNYGSWNRKLMGSRWCGFRYPDHLNYFTPKSLAAMADKAGFEIGFGLTGRLPTSDNMWAVLTKRGGAPAAPVTAA
jgi:SAM-dependent methyltransferase